MPSLDWLEALFVSRSALFMLLTLAVVWLARNNQRQDMVIESLTLRLIRLLELKNAPCYRRPEKLDPEPQAPPAPPDRDPGLG